MPIHNYKCTECDFIDEYWTGGTANKEMQPPEHCPKCEKGKLEKQFSAQGQSFDVIGGFQQVYGRKAWKKRMSLNDQAKVLQGKKDPY